MLSYVAMVADLWEAEEPRSGLGGAGVPSLLNSNALRVTVTWEPPPPPPSTDRQRYMVHLLTGSKNWLERGTNRIRLWEVGGEGVGMGGQMTKVHF